MNRWKEASRALFRRSCSSEASLRQSTTTTASAQQHPSSVAAVQPRVPWGGHFETSKLHASSQQSQWLRAASKATGFAGLGGCVGYMTAVHDRLPNIKIPSIFGDAAAMAAPAVVNITVTKDGLPVPQDHSGTGFIYSSNGCILTNAHVIADALPSSDGANGNSSNATSCSNSSADRSNSYHGTSTSGNGNGSSKPITVALQDGRIFQGSVLMFDRISDLAVVQITSNQALPVVKLGTSKGLRAGEWVLALGSPLHLQNSVTAGIISCVDRKAADLGLARVRTEYIQTDAAINKGNSGGPLVNLQGEVIGLACFKALSADGVSFAIPIDTAKDVIQQLQQRGRVIRPYIGIKMLQLTEHNAAQMRQKDTSFPEVTQGILVPHVAAGSPACKCGLREGDVITGFAGQSSNLSTNHLIHCLSQHVNRTMEVKVLRPEAGSVVLQVAVSEALQ